MFSARFDRQDGDDPKIDDIDLRKTLQINRKETESDNYNVDVRSQL